MSSEGSRGSIGEYLAQQRKLRGISVDELCELTKIPRRNIERLESGALDGSPDGFARGFVRTIADALGLDADEAVMRLMQEPEPDETPSGQALSEQHLRWAGVLGATLLLLLLWRLLGVWWSSATEPEAAPVLQPRIDAIGDLVRESGAGEAERDEAGPTPQQ